MDADRGPQRLGRRGRICLPRHAGGRRHPASGLHDLHSYAERARTIPISFFRYRQIRGRRARASVGARPWPVGHGRGELREAHKPSRGARADSVVSMADLEVTRRRSLGCRFVLGLSRGARSGLHRCRHRSRLADLVDKAATQVIGLWITRRLCSPVAAKIGACLAAACGDYAGTFATPS